MNKSIILLFVLPFLALTGCRDEITNTQNTNPHSSDSLLFYKDSIYISDFGIDPEATYRISDTNITKIKVSYSLETDDVTDTATTSSFLFAADSSFSIRRYGHNNNGNFNYTCNIKLVSTGYADATFKVNKYINTSYYIVMRNIRLYRTN